MFTYCVKLNETVLGRQCPFSPSVPAEAGCLFAVAAGVHVLISREAGCLYAVAAGVHVFISGESLHLSLIHI